MFRLIQVPLDGSSFAEHALPLAVSLARRDGAALQLVRVHEPMLGNYLDRPQAFIATLDRELMDVVRDNLDETVRRLAEKTGLRANSAQLNGSVSESIIQHASASEADLLIMTTHGHGPLARFWFGSVADALVRQSPIPILFVRPQKELPDFDHPPPVRHVLIPLDGSQLAEQALEPALSLGSAEKGEFTLLRVVPVLLPASYDPTSGRVSGIHTSWHQHLHELKHQLETEARDDLERLAERLRAKSLQVRTHLVAHEQPATAILDAASSHGVNAIAMTTRGHSGIKRLLLGSVADKVLRGATTPVLICPPVPGP